MGLFSRNESGSSSGRRSTSRASVSSEAQASELRGRARRRLIGALVLVIAAVIVVPLLLDTQPTGDEASAPLVVPAMVPRVADPGATAPSATSGDVIATAPADEAPLPTPDSVVPDAADGATAKSPDVAAAPPIAPGSDPRAGSTPESKTPAKTTPEVDRKADDKPAPSKRESRADPVERTDDGSVALALLEGRRPGRTTGTKEPAQHGSYILQIAAYSTEKDAQNRRERLVSSGVTNAYVQDAISGGKTTYRLRVGPFPTHEAAQAAQARLRALGYDNSFISTK